MAAALTGRTEVEAAALLLGRDVVLEWAASCENSAPGRTLVLTTANLIARFCPRLKLPRESELGREAARLVTAIDSSALPFAWAAPDALRLHLGGGPTSSDVAGSANGWTAYASRGQELPALTTDAKPIGAHIAGALVAGCVFAELLQLDPEVGAAWRDGWSALDFGASTSAAALPRHIQLPSDVVLVGAGAVGQAIVDVLVSVGASGELRVIDFGRADDVTNLNRCVLTDEADVAARMSKVDLIGRLAAGRTLRVIADPRRLSEVPADATGGRMSTPRIAVSAVDNKEARLELQTLDPELVIEGATGGTLSQVFRHAKGEGTACLRCLHLEDQEPSPGEALPVTSFGAYLAGVLAAAELIKAVCGIATPLVGRHQIDALATSLPPGPFIERPLADCPCQGPWVTTA